MDKIKCTAFKKWCNVSVVTPYLSSRHKQKDFSLLKPSVNRRVAVGTAEELWPGLLSGVSQRPAAQRAPVAATQAGKGSPFLSLP